MARYPTKRAVSAGGLVYDDRPDGRWVVLISRRNAAGQLQWTLPKGGLEEGEDLEAAAIREVREETGLDSEITGKLGIVDYWFVWRPDEVRYHKYVHYFLMAHRGGDTGDRDDEAEDVAWLPLEQAIARLSHPNERRLVEGARACAGPPPLERTEVVVADDAETVMADDLPSVTAGAAQPQRGSAPGTTP